MEERARAEVERLHRFITDWVSGRCDNRDEIFDDGFGRRLAPEFSIVLAQGVTLSGGQLIGVMRHAWGVNPDYELEVREISARALGDETALVTYQGWQRNAIHTERPEGCRVASGLLRPDTERDGGLLWIHIHHSWLEDPP